MKVVQINAVFKHSSTGRTTMEMHEYLQSKGIDSYSFCTNYSDADHKIYKIGNNIDRHVHALLSRILGLQGYFSYSVTRKLIKQLKEISPDIVILRNLHANYIHLRTLLAYLADYDIATIIVLHDCWFYTGHCCYYYDCKCYKWMSECHNCPVLHRYNKSLFVDNSRKIYKDKQSLFNAIPRLGVIGVSDWVTDEARKSLLSNAQYIKRIYNWIDLDIFKPKNREELRRRYGFTENDFIVLGVAQTWSEQKGLSTFLSIAEHCPKIKIVLVGKCRQHIEYNNIICAGTLGDTQQLADYYSMADVFVNPSIQETFGKVTAEALSCGTPVIGYNTTATPELISENCGYTVSASDTKSIIRYIGKIQKNGKSQYATSCREFALKNFNKQDQLDKYLSLFEQIISHE